MALSETNELKVAQILNLMVVVVEEQINLMDDRFTATVQTEIEAQIAIWDSGIGTKTTSLSPTESNKGVKTDPYAARNDVKRNIAILLERPDWASSGGRLSRS
jgi:hypothetical protein